MCKHFLLMVVLLAGCTTPGPLDADVAEHAGMTEALATDSLYDSLAAGAEVYVGTVVDHKVLSKPTNETECGTLTFRVSKTLRGTARHELRLPYNAYTDGGDAFVIEGCIYWPAFTPDTGPLVVVVMPKGYDRNVGPRLGLNGAAVSVQQVWLAKGSLVRAMEEICQLHEIKEPEDLRDRLSAAAVYGLVGWSPSDIDPEIMVRTYAEDAAIARLGHTDPSAVMKLVDYRIWYLGKAKDGEVTGAIWSMYWKLPIFYPGETKQEGMRRKAALAGKLLDMLYNPEDWPAADRNNIILKCLDYLAESDLWLDARAGVEAKRREGWNRTLTAIIAAASGHATLAVEEAQRVQTWLNRPPAPATQPAGPTH
jgi:hypothetical protein